MTIIVKSADDSTPIFVSSNDVVIIESGVTVSSATDILQGYDATGLNVFVAGVLASEGIAAGVNGGSTVTVAATGALIGRAAGLLINGVGTTLTNDGLIQSTVAGDRIAEGAVVVFGVAAAADVTVVNNGTISGAPIGLYLYDDPTGTVLDNTGTITGGTAAVGGSGGLVADNSGSIVSRGIAFEFVADTAGALRLANSGLVRGAVAIEASDTAGDRVHNTGTLDGDVFLNGGDDRYGGGGTLLGDLDLGAGNDLVRALGGGEVDGTIRAGSGLDTVRGGDADDVVDGGSGDDVLFGGGGDDRIIGGSGVDRITGGAGDDVLDGGRQGDTFVFRGDFGVDEITGFAVGADVVDLSAVGAIRSFSDLTANHLSERGGTTTIDTGEGAAVVLTGVRIADLAAGDFLF